MIMKQSDNDCPQQEQEKKVCTSPDCQKCEQVSQAYKYAQGEESIGKWPQRIRYMKAEERDDVYQQAQGRENVEKIEIVLLRSCSSRRDFDNVEIKYFKKTIATGYSFSN